MKSRETVILENLIYNDEYVKKVIPFIDVNYFSDEVDKKIFSHIRDYVNQYNSPPSVTAIGVMFENDLNMTSDVYEKCVEEVKSFSDESVDQEWLIDETEKFCKDRAIFNAINESINIFKGDSEDKKETAIPSILSDALAVSFDTHIGHDYLDDSTDRYDFYKRKEKKIAFDLDLFNQITGGGTPLKTLNVVMAGTGVGKSLFMCHHAANCLLQNLNVLYITLEMAEERIAERIDANLLDVPVNDLRELPRQVYDKKIETLKKKVKGKLIIRSILPQPQVPITSEFCLMNSN